jgi:hypothetical protein
MRTTTWIATLLPPLLFFIWVIAYLNESGVSEAFFALFGISAAACLLWGAYASFGKSGLSDGSPYFLLCFTSASRWLLQWFVGPDKG